MKYVMTIVFLFLLSGCALLKQQQPQPQPRALKTPVNMLSNYELVQCIDSKGYLTDEQIMKCRGEISYRIKNNTMTQKEWTDDQMEIERAIQQNDTEVRKSKLAAFAEYERQQQQEEQQQNLLQILQTPKNVYIHR